MKKIAILFIGIFLMLGLCSCATMKGFNDRMSNPEPLNQKEVNPVKKNTQFAALVDEYVDAFNGAKGKQAGSPEIQKYTSTGIALTKVNCSRWFQYMANNQRIAATGQKEFNIISSLATTLLGITNASKQAVAVLGAASSSLNAGYDIYEDNFVNVASSKVKKLVDERMNLQASRIQEKKAEMDFVTAYSELVYLEGICQYGEIREMLENLINKAEVVDAGKGVVPVPAPAAVPAPVAVPPAPAAVPAPAAASTSSVQINHDYGLKIKQ